MKRLIVTRQSMQVASMVPFWVIPGSKQAFMIQFGLEGDFCQTDKFGQPVPRIDPNILDANGERIANGEQITIDLADNVRSVFASTYSGSLSNEVLLQGGQFINGAETFYLNMTVKGGLTSCSYPWFE